jgi:hypothetical protein
MNNIERKLFPKIKRIFRSIMKNRSLEIFILIIVVLIGHRGWFKPGLLDYGDMWAIPKETLVKFFTFPYIWLNYFYLGAYDSLFYMYPQFWLFGLVANLGFDYSISQRVVYFFPYLFFSIFSMYYFTYVLFKKRVICFFATLFFVFNTFVLSIVDGGIVDSAIGYALCPLILAFFIKGLQQKQPKYSILTGICLSLSIAYYPPAAYLTIGAISLFFIDSLISQIKSYDDFVKKNTVKLISHLIIVLVVPFVLHFYWILPALLVKIPKVIPGHEHAGWVYTLSYAKLSHALSIYSVSWPPGSSGVQPVPLQYFAIPLIVLIGILARLKDRNVRLLAIIAVISVFFAKGTNRPFGEIYAWFFKYFPGGSMFRTPGKFHCLTNLAYAPLLGVGIDYLSDILGKVKLRNLRTPFKNSILKPIFLISMFCFMIYLVFPAFQGKLVGTFKAKQMPKEYEIIKEFIKSQPPHFRTFWRPIKGRYAFYSQDYPLFDAYQYHFYTSESSRYFLSEAYNPKAFEQTKHIAKILGILNIKYYFLPLEREYLFRGKEFYLETFENQIGLKKINLGKNIEAFENQYFAPRFFGTTHGLLVVGGLKSLFSLASLEGMDFSRWAIFFADQLKEKSKNLFSNLDTFVFYNRDINDLVLSLVDKEYRMELTNYVIQRSDSGRPGTWVKGVYPVEQTFDGVITHNSRGVIYRDMNIGNSIPSRLNTPIPFDVKEDEDYEIWIRPAKGPDRGKLSVIMSKDPQMKNPIKQILTEEDLRDKYHSFQWVNAGTLFLEQGRYFFQVIHHAGPIGIVDQLVIVPKKIIDSLQKNILNVLRNKDVVLLKEPADTINTIYIPEDGTYRIASNIFNRNFSGNLIVSFNNKLLKEEKLSAKNSDFWIETEPVDLQKGLSNIVISKNGEGELEIQKVIIYKSNTYSNVSELFSIKEESFPVSWQMINPTRYYVKLKIERPMYLVFSEGFDSRWILNLKKPVSSMIAYGMLNSFFIEQTGQMGQTEIDATLEFTPQRYVHMGLWVSGIGLTLICFYFLYRIINLLKRKKKMSHSLES